MAPTKSQIFCVQAQDINSCRSFYMNYGSDTSEKTSLKLPVFMVQAALGTRKVDWGEQLINMTLYRKEMRASIMEYLTARYGENMPDIYTTLDFRDLVMDIYIHHGHSKVLKKFKKRDPYKLHYLRLVLTTIQQRILELANKSEGFERYITSGPFLKSCQEKLEELGEEVSKNSICSFFLDQNSSEQQVVEPERAAKVGDNLLTFAYQTVYMKRSLYFNVVADSSPESIRWSEAMVNWRRLPPEGEYDSATNKHFEDVVDYSLDCLEDYHDKHGLIVHLAKDSTDLIFTVPVHVNHAEAFKLYFTHSKLKKSFYKNVLSYYERHFYALDQPDWSNNHTFVLKPIQGGVDHPPIGREAKEKETISVILLKKNIAPKNPNWKPIKDGIRKYIWVDRLWRIP